MTVIKNPFGMYWQCQVGWVSGMSNATKYPDQETAWAVIGLRLTTKQRVGAKPVPFKE